MNPRKPRTIKNGSVDYDVSVEPGLGYANWLPIAKQKLLYRELKSLHQRQCVVDELIFEEIQQQTISIQNMNNASTIHIYQTEIRHKVMNANSAIMRRCAQSLAAVLHKWNGYQPTAKTQIHSFLTYFQGCRRWFDRNKLTVMVCEFWLPIMRLIQEFAMKVAAQLFGDQELVRRKAYSEYLNASVLKSMFEGGFTPPNTRRMWLIPAMAYSIISKNYKRAVPIVPGNSTGNKEIRLKYLKQFRIRHNDLRDVFHRSTVPVPAPPIPPATPNPYAASNPFTLASSVIDGGLWFGTDGDTQILPLYPQYCGGGSVSSMATWSTDAVYDSTATYHPDHVTYI